MPPSTRQAVLLGPCIAALLLLVAGCGGSADPGTPDAARTSVSGVPALHVEVLADGLDHPWDVAQAPDGTLLFDERAGGLTVVLPDGTVRALDASFDDPFATGETGLMGLALDPGFAGNRRFYTCQG